MLNVLQIKNPRATRPGWRSRLAAFGVRHSSARRLTAELLALTKPRRGRRNYPPSTIIETQRRGEVTDDLIRHLANCVNRVASPIVGRAYSLRRIRTLSIASS